MPETIPNLSHDDWMKWKELSYSGVVGDLLRLFVDESELTGDEISGNRLHFVNISRLVR